MEASNRGRWRMLFRIKTSARVFLRDAAIYHTVFDLVNASLSSVLPLAIFLLVGQAAKDCAGPSVCLSVVLAALSSILSGCCYAELRSRCHRGQTTAYEYIYRVGGEVLAFIAGWSLLLHHLASTATAARAISANIDSLTSYTLSNLSLTHVGQLPTVNATLDFVAFFISLVAMLLVSVNIIWPQHRIFNTVLTCTCSLVTIFAIVVALFRLNFKNWASTQLFFNDGAIGVFSGAAIIALAFSTYELTFRSTDFTSRVIRRPVILTESLNFSLTAVLLIVVGSVMTLISLSSQLSSEAPLAEAFLHSHTSWMMYFVSVLSVILLIPFLLGQFHASVVMLGDMSRDGLLPELFASESQDNHLPLWSAALCGLLSACTSMIFNLTSLAQTAAITFLLVHATSALVVLALRFRPTEESANEAQKRRQVQKRLRRRTGHSIRNNNKVEPNKNHYGSTAAPPENQAESPSPSSSSPSSSTPSSSSTLASIPSDVDDVELLGRQESLQGRPREDLSSSDSDIDDVVEEYKFNVCIRVLSEQRHRDFFLKTPTVDSYRRALLGILGFVVSSVCVAAMLLRGQSHIAKGQPGIFVVLAFFLIVLMFCLVVIARQPMDTVESAFLLIKVPWVPWLPLLGVFISMHLVVSLPGIPWVMLSVWSLIGLVIYFAFSLKNSNEAQVEEHSPGEQRGLLPPLPSRQTVSAKIVPASTGHPPARGYRNLSEETDGQRVIEERA